MTERPVKYNNFFSNHPRFTEKKEKMSDIFFIR